MSESIPEEQSSVTAPVEEKKPDNVMASAPGPAALIQRAQKEDLCYNRHLEEVIASEAEKALVLRWLHDQSEKRYSLLNTYIAIPVIVISTLAGTASIGQESLFGTGDIAPIVIGLMSLSVSVLNVVSNFFSWAKRAEGHRISSINYGKLHRWISIELSLPRTQRVPAKHFLKEIREQIDRLSETSPPIPQSVIDTFRTKLKGINDDVSLPVICNEIKTVEVYRGTNIEKDDQELGELVGKAAAAFAEARKRSSVKETEEDNEKEENTVIEVVNPTKTLQGLVGKKILSAKS
jgi:hypothetical protein